MSDTTQGLLVRSGPAALRAGVELLSSMRFAISLLTLICVASVIGTVLKQQEPAANYVNQFGPFWAALFATIGLDAVYGAWWFVLILAALVLSTSLCIARNAPKILVDLRAYKENLREQSLDAFHHKAQAELSGPPEAQARRIAAQLAASGWKLRLQQRQTAAGSAWMLAAKAGAANKIGYLAAHSAIVLICIGGLLDGNLMVRAQMLLGGKTPYQGGGLIADVGPEHRLSERNPAFRGNLLVAEGARAATAVLNQSKGVVLQELPFAIELKKFIVEHYSSGMPKRFASDIILHDKATGAQTPARVEVNQPLRYQGVEIYQSGFDDGGSRLTLRALPMAADAKAFTLQGVVGQSTQLSREGSAPLTLEFTTLRTINVENFAAAAAPGDALDLRQLVQAHLGAANKTARPKELRNVGPSVGYKLRDAAGQAREFHNYMLPVDTGDGAPVFLLGVREAPEQPLRYLRVPVDEQGAIDGFLRLKAALADPEARAQAVRRYAAQAIDAARPELAEPLRESASRVLALFAGQTPPGDGPSNGPPGGGLQAISDFMQAHVPEAERERAGEALVRILNGSLFELAQLTRERAALPPLPRDERSRGFMTQALLALSDAQLYPAPLAFALEDFEQVQASVFQLARAPGKWLVYLGCALLIAGVFAMLYVRERRVWVWITPRGALSQARMAWSSTRKTIEGDQEFARLARQLLGREPTHEGSV